MQPNPKPCPDCETPNNRSLDRRGFLSSLTAAAATGAFGNPLFGSRAPTPKSTAETAVKALFDTLSAAQKKTICFDWDHMDAERGLLRTHVSNFWAITKPFLTDTFYTKDQQALLMDVIGAWVNIVESDAAAARMAAIKEKVGETYFAWSGPTEKGKAAYFRVQGPGVVIEYAPQGGTSHKRPGVIG